MFAPSSALATPQRLTLPAFHALGDEHVDQRRVGNAHGGRRLYLRADIAVVRVHSSNAGIGVLGTSVKIEFDDDEHCLIGRIQILASRSKCSGVSEPGAFEAQSGSRADQIVVAVVVQNAELVTISKRCNQQIDPWKEVMPASGKLPLGLDR